MKVSDDSTADKVSPATVKTLVQNELRAWRSIINRAANGKFVENVALIPISDLSRWAKCSHNRAKKIKEFHSSTGNFSAYWATVITCGNCWARFIIEKKYLET